MLIVEAHLDTFGHVNNATYLQLFEQARWDMITRRGFGLDAIHQGRRGPVILDVFVKFRAELKNREEVVIESRLDSYKKKIGKLQQVIRKSDGSVACEAAFTIGLWDLDERKLLLPTPLWLSALGVETTET